MDCSVGRYYDPTTGQFLSVDPKVQQTRQAYTYADDDPVMAGDPTGYWWCLPKGASGPCKSGYSYGPPWNMKVPYNDQNVLYMLKYGPWKGDYLMKTFSYTIHHKITIIRPDGTIVDQNVPCISGCQKSANPTPSAANDDNGFVGNAGSCIAGAASNLINEGKDVGWFAGVFAFAQAIPVIDVGVDAVTVMASAGNAVFGCVSGIVTNGE